MSNFFWSKIYGVHKVENKRTGIFCSPLVNRLGELKLYFELWWLSYGTLGFSNWSWGVSLWLSFCVVTGRAFPYMVTCLLALWWENKHIGRGGGKEPPMGQPQAEMPTHMGERCSSPPPNTFHSCQLGIASVCTAPKYSNWVLTASHQADTISLYFTREQWDSEKPCNQPQVIQPIYIWARFWLKPRQAPKPDSFSRWETEANGFACSYILVFTSAAGGVGHWSLLQSGLLPSLLPACSR